MILHNWNSEDDLEKNASSTKWNLEHSFLFTLKFIAYAILHNLQQVLEERFFSKVSAYAHFCFSSQM